VIQAIKENVSDIIYCSIKFEYFSIEGIKGILGEQGNTGPKVNIHFALIIKE
jgi:hypothetical protein